MRVRFSVLDCSEGSVWAVGQRAGPRSGSSLSTVSVHSPYPQGPEDAGVKMKSKGTLGHSQGTFHATGAVPLPTLLCYLGRSSRSFMVAQQTSNFSQSRQPLENSRHSFHTALPLLSVAMVFEIHTDIQG